VYEKAFPYFQEMLNHRMDGEHQRAGVDRSIILFNSKQILIDEKVRFRNEKTGKVYEDVLLEYLSDVDRSVPGWVCKPLRADYIAYAIAPLGRCFLLPVPAMQQAWSQHGECWIREHGYRDALNDGWLTRSCPVTVAELFSAMGQMLRIDFTPVEDESTTSVGVGYPNLRPTDATPEEKNDPDFW
jgi:hypothetical protein